MMFFWMRGWETNTVLGLIKHRKAFWLFQHNCPFLFSLVDSGSVYSTIHNMQQPTDSYFSSAVTVNLPSRKWMIHFCVCSNMLTQSFGFLVLPIHRAHSGLSVVPIKIPSFPLIIKFVIISVLTLMFTSSMDKTLSVTIFFVWKFPDALIVFLDSPRKCEE